MRSEHTYPKAILCAILACVALAILALPVLAKSAPWLSWASGKPSDTEQILGVGAKADAMGDAFVAVANDPTAAFWNPAGLSLLQTTELTAVMKSLPGVTQATSIRDLPVALGPDFPGFDSVTLSDSTSWHTTSSEASFLSVTAPIGKDPARRGTISISRALAGFVERDWTIDQQFIDGSSSIISTQDWLRVDYNSLSYGWKPSDTLSTGVGVVQAVASASQSGSGTMFVPSFDPSPITIDSSSTDGKGYGGIVGLLWTPKSGRAGTLTLGGSYLSKITLSGFDSSSFGDERPDRLLLGANYRQVVPGSDTGNEVQWSLQLSRNGTANLDDGGQLARNAVWNFYFGGEYDFRHAGGAGFDYPIRYGLFTNKSPNDNVYGTETWLTFGFGAGRSTEAWQAEFALQRGLRTGMSLLSLSGGYSF